MADAPQKTLAITVNGTTHSLDAEPEMPLLWALREQLGSIGTRFGCGIAACGACTVHVGGEPIRSCVTPLAALDGKAVTTIEGITGPVIEALRQAWVAHDVPQCGYCQSGQLMGAAALLARIPVPTDPDIDAAMQGHLCRCGSYPRIRAAIHAAAQSARSPHAPATPPAA